MAGNPNWTKGVSGNPNGRPKVFSLDDLKEAMDKVAEVKKQTLLERAVEMAYKEPSVMIALLKKILPDQVELGSSDFKVTIGNSN